MQTLRDRVAVVTGAASGMGRAFAYRCAHEGMHVVLADIEEMALRKTASELEATGTSILAVVADVAREESVAELARQTLDKFAAVHLLFNNAGVVEAGTKIWEHSIADWKWEMGVNLWGVIHGLRTFIPIMIQQKGEECHIVNMSSAAGVSAGPHLGIYRVTKHSVVSISETLYYELAQYHPHIKVSVVCPGFVQTRIMEAGRNRSVVHRNEPNQQPVIDQTVMQGMIDGVREGIPPEDVATQVFDAIRNEQLYVVTHSDDIPYIRMRADDIAAQRNPSLTD